MNKCKKEILDEISDLFVQYGIKSVTMDEISRTLGMSKKTLYCIFNSREGLVEQAIQHLYEKYSKITFDLYNSKMNSIQIMLELHKCNLESLKKINPSFEFDLRKYHTNLYNRIKADKIVMFKNLFKQNITKGKEEGLYRENIDEEIIARLFIASMDSFYTTDHFSTDDLYSENVVTQVFLYHLHGIASIKGIEYLNTNLNLLKASK